MSLSGCLRVYAPIATASEAVYLYIICICVAVYLIDRRSHVMHGTVTHISVSHGTLIKRYCSIVIGYCYGPVLVEQKNR